MNRTERAWEINRNLQYRGITVPPELVDAIIDDMEDLDASAYDRGLEAGAEEGYQQGQADYDCTDECDNARDEAYREAISAIEGLRDANR